MDSVSKIIEDIFKEEVEKAIKEIKEARKEAEEKNFNCFTNIIIVGFSKGKLLELGFTEDEYREAY